MQAFIPDWPGTKQHAKENVRILAPYCSSVTTLDDPKDYFGNQWLKAKALLTDDIMILNMADCWPPIYTDRTFDRIVNYLDFDTGVGVYSPLIRWSNWQFPQNKELSKNLFEVPIVEMLFFAVRREIVEAMPSTIDYYGIGVAYALTAAAWKLGYKVVCDHSVVAAHPEDTAGYPKTDATAQMNTWINLLDKSEAVGIRSVMQECFQTVLTGEQNMKPFKITKEEIELWRR